MRKRLNRILKAVGALLWRVGGGYGDPETDLKSICVEHHAKITRYIGKCHAVYDDQERSFRVKMENSIAAKDLLGVIPIRYERVTLPISRDNPLGDHYEVIASIEVVERPPETSFLTFSHL